MLRGWCDSEGVKGWCGSEGCQGGGMIVKGVKGWGDWKGVVGGMGQKWVPNESNN